jgi:hypothetical protein
MEEIFESLRFVGGQRQLNRAGHVFAVIHQAATSGLLGGGCQKTSSKMIASGMATPARS